MSTESDDMTDDELLRYSRQIMLPEFDIAGQEKLRASTALIIGLGGLGSPIAMYLAAAGVGHVMMADDDCVDLSNLQRQIVHETDSIDLPKVESAAQRIRALNPNTKITTFSERLVGDALTAAVQAADVVLDATDNFSSRFDTNQVCVETGTPLVSGAAIRMEGQVAVFDTSIEGAPCYRCLYPTGTDEALNCAENGVAAPLVGIVGSIQAMEAMKVIADVGETLTGYVLYVDAKRMDWRKLKLPKNPGCRTCGEHA